MDIRATKKEFEEACKAFVDAETEYLNAKGVIYGMMDYRYGGLSKINWDAIRQCGRFGLGIHAERTTNFLPNFPE